MEVFGAWFSPFSRRVELGLKLKGIEEEEPLHPQIQPCLQEGPCVRPWWKTNCRLHSYSSLHRRHLEGQSHFTSTSLSQSSCTLLAQLLGWQGNSFRIYI